MASPKKMRICANLAYILAPLYSTHNSAAKNKDQGAVLQR